MNFRGSQGSCNFQLDLVTELNGTKMYPALGGRPQGVPGPLTLSIFTIPVITKIEATSLIHV